jgi:hypothetical protein
MYPATVAALSIVFMSLKNGLDAAASPASTVCPRRVARFRHGTFLARRSRRIVRLKGGAVPVRRTITRFLSSGDDLSGEILERGRLAGFCCGAWGLKILTAGIRALGNSCFTTLPMISPQTCPVPAAGNANGSSQSSLRILRSHQLHPRLAFGADKT